MGRFDALTTLTEDKETKSSAPVVLTPLPNEPETKKKHADHANHDKDKIQEIMKSGKPAAPPLPSTSSEKPMKYSTLIDPGLIKQIKLYAAERELKDYEVIERALIAYFEKSR